MLNTMSLAQNLIGKFDAVKFHKPAKHLYEARI